MLEISMSAAISEFDAKHYMGNAQDSLRDEMIYAAREFYLAATPRVHVDTGMALGSYTAFAKLVRQRLDLSKRRIYRKPKTYIHNYAAKMPKLPETGAALSSKYSEILVNVGNRNNPKFDFNFYTGVWHYREWDINGFKNLPYPPWQSFQAGEDAFLKAMITSADRMPPITSSFETRIYKFDPVVGIFYVHIIDQRKVYLNPRRI